MSHTTMRRGFTLIELLVVIAIIAILVALLHRVFPPGVLGTSDTPAQNHLLHRWAVQILPCVDQKLVADACDFNVRFDRSGVHGESASCSGCSACDA